MAVSNHPFTAIDDQNAEVNCQQCGYTYLTPRRGMMADRPTEWWLCKSCKAVPVDKCWYGDDWCRPWKGDFDLDVLMCLDEKGQPYMVGPRTCGHWDCVREDHQLVLLARHRLSANTTHRSGITFI